MPAGRSSTGPPLYGAPIGHPAQHAPPPGYSHPGHPPIHHYGHPGYPAPGGYDPRMGAPPPGSYPHPSGYGAPPPGYAPPAAAQAPPQAQPGPASTGGPGDFARERPEAYSAFEQMAIQPAPAGGTEVRLPEGMCRDKHVADFLQCLKCWLWHHQGDPRTIGRPWRIRCLDLSRNGLSDSSACQVLDALQRMDLRVERLHLAGNGIEAKGFAKLVEYVWNCQDPFLELNVSHNQVEADPNGSEPGSDAISGLLRCLYNHASYPQIITGTNGVAQVLPLTLHLNGNRVKEPARLLKRMQAKGGKKHIQIRPNAEPYDHVGKEYLSVCLPNFLEQALPEEKKEKKRTKEKKHRSRSAEPKIHGNHHKVRLTPAKDTKRGTEKAKKSSRRESRDKAHAPKTGEPEHWHPASPRASSEDSNRRGRAKNAKKPRREAVVSPAARSSSESPDSASPTRGKPDGAAGPVLVITDEEQKNLQREVGAKLVSVGGLPSEEATLEMLSEFVVCMAVAGKPPEQIHRELEVFLASEATAFVKWFSDYIQKWKRR